MLFLSIIKIVSAANCNLDDTVIPKPTINQNIDSGSLIQSEFERMEISENSNGTNLHLNQERDLLLRENEIYLREIKNLTLTIISKTHKIKNLDRDFEEYLINLDSKYKCKKESISDVQIMHHKASKELEIVQESLKTCRGEKKTTLDQIDKQISYQNEIIRFQDPKNKTQFQINKEVLIDLEKSRNESENDFNKIINLLERKLEYQTKIISYYAAEELKLNNELSRIYDPVSNHRKSTEQAKSTLQEEIEEMDEKVMELNKKIIQNSEKIEALNKESVNESVFEDQSNSSENTFN